MSFFFFFNDTATTEIYTLSLHDALPIYLGIYRLQVIGKNQTLMRWLAHRGGAQQHARWGKEKREPFPAADRKSTRLNSSHGYISYAVFCLKKKKNTWSKTHSREQIDKSL